MTPRLARQHEDAANRLMLAGRFGEAGRELVTADRLGLWARSEAANRKPVGLP